MINVFNSTDMGQFFAYWNQMIDMVWMLGTIRLSNYAPVGYNEKICLFLLLCSRLYLVFSSGKYQISLQFPTTIPIGQRLKSAPQEDFFYVVTYVSCFPSCQEGFFNVEKEQFVEHFRSTWELDWWPIVFCTNWHLGLCRSTSHLDDLDKS